MTSYSTLRTLPLASRLAAAKLPITMLVADEAHYIKNPDSLRTQAVRELARISTYATLMSGTPMENHPSEFLELLEAIRPGERDTITKGIADIGGAFCSPDKFQEAASLFYLRRNQNDVLAELPELIEVEEWVDLTKSDLDAYRDAVFDRNFMGMRRAATIGSGAGRSAKLDCLDALLRDHRVSDRKVLIFSYFLDVLSEIERRQSVCGTISGKIQSVDRMRLVDEFQNRPGHAILLAQIEAGGQGLNVQAASAVVIMEPQFKPTTEAQAIARAHRMGQTESVLVHRLLARGCVDEHLKRNLHMKQELFDAYARESLVKESSPRATSKQIESKILRMEEERLRAA